MDNTQEVPVTETGEVGIPQEEQSTVQVDYKAELEKAQERLRKAEYSLKKANVESKKTPSFDPLEVQRMIEEGIEKKVTELRQADSVGDLEETLYSITENEAERELIRHYYENKLVKSGFSRSAIRDDLLLAKSLANSTQVQKQNAELSAALKAKATVGTAPMGSHVPPERGPDYMNAFNPVDLQVMKDNGFTPEQMKKAAEKIISDRTAAGKA